MDLFEICGFTFFGTMFLFGPCLAWPEFVEAEGVRNSDIRRVMMTVFSICTLVELLLWMNGDIETWSLGLIAVSNVWGMLDAVLRFPVIHGPRSFFFWKQLFLLLLKTWCYVVGFHSAITRLAVFVVALLGLVFVMPLLYITALPIGDKVLQAVKHDAVDVDITLQFLRLCHDDAARSRAAASLRSIMHRTVYKAASRWSCLRKGALLIFPLLSPHLRCGPTV